MITWLSCQLSRLALRIRCRFYTLQHNFDDGRFATLAAQGSAARRRSEPQQQQFQLIKEEACKSRKGQDWRRRCRSAQQEARGALSVSQRHPIVAVSDARAPFQAISQSLNRFDVKTNSKKHQILGAKPAKGSTGRPGLSKQAGIENVSHCER